MLDKQEQKDQIQQAKTELKIAKYSKDYDSTLIIRWIFGILAGIFFGLFCLEIIALVLFDKEPGVYLTGGVILASLAYVAGWCSSAVTSHFTKKAQEASNGQNKGV